MPEHQDAAFRTFEDLDVYQKAREFRKRMYAAARKLPDFEKYELGRQIRRAAVSLTNNIAECHGRYHYLDEIKFQIQSRGSLAELLDDLNVCHDEHYLPTAEIVELKERAKEVQRLINGYIRFLRERKAGASLTVRESAGEDELLYEFRDTV
ncbi:MAG: four helix bundle protein [Verrucomicrobia bacterium]|nr:MAG: four helix bundle protein [Verrucomicrobiota bacterium]